MTAVEFQCVTWYAQDEAVPHAYNRQQCYVHCFGKTLAGAGVHVKVPYDPYFYVRGRCNGCFVKELRKRMGATCSEFAVQKSGFETKLNFFGFSNNTPLDVTKLCFTSMRAFRSARYHLKQAQTEMFESHVDVQLKFLHETGLRSVGWVRVSGCQVDRDGSLQCEASCLSNLDADSTAAFAPLVIASYDIEAYSPSGRFPDADNESDVMFMIATTFQRFGNDQPYLRHLVSLDACANIPGLLIEQATDEGELVQKWTDMIRKQGTDVLLAYNNYGFDDYYIYTRFKRFRPHAPLQLSELSSGSYIKTQRSEFAGYSDWRLLVTPGILNLDMHVIMKREHKLDSYKLDAVAEHFLGEHKIDLPVKAMFAKYANGRGGRDGNAISEIGRYCAQDTALPLSLLSRLSIIPTMFEMAAATSVPCDYIFQRGASVRVTSMLVKRMHEYGMICPSRVIERESYQGSTILEAKTGIFWDPVAVCDFASLYPSIIRRHCLCPSRLVLDERFGNLHGVHYMDIETDAGTHRFAQDAEHHDNAGNETTADSTGRSKPLPQAVVPSLLADLAELRKQAKNELAHAADPWQRTLLDAKQMAFKVCMNAVYGAFGAPGPLFSRALAASVTAIGRRMIAETKDIVEKHVQGAEVVFGDTDSLFIRFGCTLDVAFTKGKQFAELITLRFGGPVKLELEKVFWPLLLVGKKQYAGLQFSMPGDAPNMNVKGLGVIRRDSCKHTRKTCISMLNCILCDHSVQAAKDIAKSAAQQLLRGQVDPDQLIMSKKLGDQYKTDNHAHVQVAKQIADRVAAGETQEAPPQAGDRVEFLYSTNPAKAANLKARDPSWLLNHPNLKVDYDYYFKHCFKSQVMSLLLAADLGCEELFKDILREHSLRKDKQSQITAYFRRVQ